MGSPWSNAEYIEVIVDKGAVLAYVPMTLRMERIEHGLDVPKRPSQPSEFVLLDGGRVLVRAGEGVAGEILASPGTVLRCLPHDEPAREICYGGEKIGGQWTLTHPRASVGFVAEPGEMRRVTLAFTAPATLKPGMQTNVVVFQRNDQRVITGNVILQLNVKRERQQRAARPATKKAGRHRRG